MHTCKTVSLKDCVMMSEKSCLSFKTIKGSLGMCDCWGRWGARNRALSCLVGVGRSQQVTEIPVILSLTAVLDTFQVTGLRKTHQISCHSLWLGREGKGSGTFQEVWVNALYTWKRVVLEKAFSHEQDIIQQ